MSTPPLSWCRSQHAGSYRCHPSSPPGCHSPRLRAHPYFCLFPRRSIIKGGANVNLADGEGVSPLQHARTRGYRKIEALLLAANAG